MLLWGLNKLILAKFRTGSLKIRFCPPIAPRCRPTAVAQRFLHPLRPPRLHIIMLQNGTRTLCNYLSFIDDRLLWWALRKLARGGGVPAEENFRLDERQFN